MPQCGRKVAFSNKKKKEQLKARKQRKKFVSAADFDDVENPSTAMQDSAALSVEGKVTLATLTKHVLPYLDDVEEINRRHSKNSKYNLKFRKIKGEKDNQLHYQPISPISDEDLEADSSKFFPTGLDFPKRPLWTKNMSKLELEQSENKSFRLFCDDLDRKFASEELSLYELNLETWRQLWRVIEMSDILLIIVDARFPVAQFPPYLYKHLVEIENKEVILLLNKCDLLPSSLILAWQDYFNENYPRIIVLPFSSFEGRELKKTNLKMASEGAHRLINACQKLMNNKVDLNLWRQKVEEEKHEEYVKCEVLRVEDLEKNPLPEDQQRLQNVLTLGTIGHPNVGKSSIINALKGKKVVSVSRTPGHTKHFQTIFLTKNVRLCDCPGLVFPSLCPKQIQVVIGSYPISQVRDPLTSIAFIASRLDLPSILKLSCKAATENSETQFKWTPFYICEAWAIKRGYFTRTKGGRPDISRAANELLRCTLIGSKSLILTLKPPGFSKNQDKYRLDLRRQEIHLIQGMYAKKEEEEVMVHEGVTKEVVERDSEDEESDCLDDDFQDSDTDSSKVANEEKNEPGLSNVVNEEQSEEDSDVGSTLNKYALLSMLE